MSRQPPGLVARIRQLRRAGGPPDVVAAVPDEPPADLADGSSQLRARIAELEQLVQGLQDSIYRESQRQDKRITELEQRIDPAALAAALSKDARERGL